MASTGKIRAAAIGVVVALALGCVAIFAGLRYNGTSSFPAGFYRVSGKHAVKGNLVLVDIPALPVLEMAKERGYLNVAYSPVERIMKRLVAVAGDRVTIDTTGVQVNRIRLANSAPLPCDGVGRPLQACVLNRILEPNEVLLMSDYNPASFDSRYFGPIEATSIELAVRPVLTWN
jgi:conjugative transfer signal peptidase TraF